MDLLEQLHFFEKPLPTEHLQNVCRMGKGEKTCRYLTLTGDGPICSKFTSLMHTISDRMQSGEMKSKGDNCAGKLGVIVQQKEKLIGHNLLYQEIMPTVRVETTLKDLMVVPAKNAFIIVADDSSLPLLITNLNYLQVDVLPQKIIFTIAGVGVMAGKTSISI